MVLGLDFIIIASIIILMLTPLYIYRRKIFKFAYPPVSSFDTQVKILRKYLAHTYPKVFFDFSIVENTKDEPNDNTRLVMIVEDLTSQFVYYDAHLYTQANVGSENLWDTYQINSIPKRDKLPIDWPKRKATTWLRDEKACVRCGLKVSKDDAKVDLLRPIDEDGTYHFENLVTLCVDCSKITSSKDLSKTLKSTEFQDKLITIIDGFDEE